MTMDTIWNLVLAALVSGIVATVLTIIHDRRHTAKIRKLDLLRRLVAYRSVPPNKEFRAALNEVPITFNSDREVVAAWTGFSRNTAARGGHDNNDLLRLIKEMMRAMKLNTRGINDDDFLHTFLTGQD